MKGCRAITLLPAAHGGFHHEYDKEEGSMTLQAVMGYTRQAERIQVRIGRTNIDSPIHYYRRGRKNTITTNGSCPDGRTRTTTTAYCSEPVHLIRGDIDDTIGYRRRGDDGSASSSRPDG